MASNTSRRLTSRALIAVAAPLFLAAALPALAQSTKPATRVQTATIDRSKPPTLPPLKALRVPPIAMRTLSNGIKVAVLENHEIPIVRVSALVDAGGLFDPVGKDGLSSLTFQMLGEGTTTRTAEQLADAFASLGTVVSPSGFTTILPNVDPALELMRDQLYNPSFPQASLDRIKANTISSLRRAKDQPNYIAQRVLVNVLYGHGHPYERTTTEESVNSITRDDLAAFHSQYFRPQNVKFVVAGDITPAAAVAKLEKVFASWPKGGVLAKYDVPEPKQVDKTTIYLFDRPASTQSVLIASAIGPRRDDPSYYALDLANNILGGTFSSRLNMNLREAHGYSYGASSGFSYRRAPQLGQFSASSEVNIAKTDSALIEMMKEVRGLSSDRPITDEDFQASLANSTKGLALNFETVSQIAGAAGNVLSNNLPLDYYQQLSANYTKVTPAEARAAAQKFIDPSRLAIIIVGDRKVIEPGLRAANIAPIVIVDENGKPVGGAQ